MMYSIDGPRSLSQHPPQDSAVRQTPACFCAAQGKCAMFNTVLSLLPSGGHTALLRVFLKPLELRHNITRTTAARRA